MKSKVQALLYLIAQKKCLLKVLFVPLKIKKRASGCTVSNKDDSNIDDDSIIMHNQDPTANGLNITEKKVAWNSRSPKPMTENTPKRTHDFLVKYAKVTQILLEVFIVIIFE